MIELGQFLVGKTMPMTSIYFISYKSQYLSGIWGKIATGEQGGGSFGPTSWNGVIEVSFVELAEQVARGNPFEIVTFNMDYSLVNVKPFGGEFETEVATIAERENIFGAVEFAPTDGVGITTVRLPRKTAKTVDYNDIVGD
jgi:hypothetical protein